MAKNKIKFGKVELPDDEFKEENISVRISIMLPRTLIKDLKSQALTEKHAGKYQVLIKDVLQEYVEKNKVKKKKTA